MAPRRGERSGKRATATLLPSQAERLVEASNLPDTDAFWSLGGGESAVEGDDFSDQVPATFGEHAASSDESGQGVGRGPSRRHGEDFAHSTASPSSRGADSSHYLSAVVDLARFETDAAALGVSLGIRRDAGRPFGQALSSRADANAASSAPMLFDSPTQQSPERPSFSVWLDAATGPDTGVVTTSTCSAQPASMPSLTARPFTQNVPRKSSTTKRHHLSGTKASLLSHERLHSAIDSGADDMSGGVHLRTDDELARAKIFDSLRDPDSDRGALMLADRDQAGVTDNSVRESATLRGSGGASLTMPNQALNWDDEIPQYMAHDGTEQLGRSTGASPLERHIHCPKCSDPELNKPVCPACRQRHHRMLKHAPDGRCQWGEVCRLCSRRQRQRARRKSVLPVWDALDLDATSSGRAGVRGGDNDDVDDEGANAHLDASASLLSEGTLGDHGLLLTTAKRVRRNHVGLSRRAGGAGRGPGQDGTTPSGTADKNAPGSSLQSRSTLDALLLHQNCQACCPTQVCGNCRKRHSRMMQRQGVCDWGDACRLCTRKRRKQLDLSLSSETGSLPLPFETTPETSSSAVAATTLPAAARMTTTRASPYPHEATNHRSLHSPNASSQGILDPSHQTFDQESSDERAANDPLTGADLINTAPLNRSSLAALPDTASRYNSKTRSGPHS